MCVLALAWRTHPEWRLVAVGNRDELHSREALALARWEDAPGVIAGRDVMGGGTWLGVEERGRFAVVTNVRNPDGPDPAKLSRGALVTDMLTDGSGAALTVRPEAYNPFSLIAVDGGHAHLMTNRPEALVKPLAPGMHGLSNGVMDAPWPKTAKLERALAGWIEAGSGDTGALFDVLADETPPRGMVEGEDEAGEREPVASPIFIRNPVYGTRCSTVVTVDADGNGVIAERRFDGEGNATGETRIDFRWPEIAE
ncbi:NRDE family protein [Sphingomonadaceae bacterium LXI357]|uniref:NRDE family protein n=2 Tax=Stakelama marina TaxID=2826939 RepID=A0A8T4IGX7_9SPHN|nr:NRDE family protein [Stakelama marina]MBR0553883.1 NRDE family protein [Stakelama marina]